MMADDELRAAAARATQLCERLEAHQAEAKLTFGRVKDWLIGFEKAVKEGVELEEAMNRIVQSNLPNES
jgi:hypothetical protein